MWKSRFFPAACHEEAHLDLWGRRRYLSLGSGIRSLYGQPIGRAPFPGNARGLGRAPILLTDLRNLLTSFFCSSPPVLIRHSHQWNLTACHLPVASRRPAFAYEST